VKNTQNNLMKLKLYFLVLIIMMSILIIPLVSQGSKTRSQQLSKSQQLVKLYPNGTITDEWILALQDNFDHPQWFYENLNNTERKMIRQAMDYAIPRQEIIDVIMDGLGQSLATPIVPQFGKFFNNSTNARELNLTKAVNLLAEVFGYSYNSSFFGDTLKTPYDERLPYFRLTTIVPHTNIFRSQWAGRIALSFTGIGIRVEQTFLPFPTLVLRIFDVPNIGEGWDFAHGGFDALFLGYVTDDALPEVPIFFYDPAVKPPFGRNYYWLDDPISNDLISNALQITNSTLKLQAFHDWQLWFLENVPASILHQSIDVYGLDIDFKGFNPDLFSNYENWTIGAQSNATIAFSWFFADLTPAQEKLLIDVYIGRGGIFGRDTTPTELGTIIRPYLAETVNVSADGLTYTIDLHSGITWHDGTPLNATDIKFTFDALIDPDVDASNIFFWLSFLNNESVTIINETRVEINFIQPFFNFEVALTEGILPSHILNSIPKNQWRSYYTNLQNGTSGPIGYGPYKYQSFDNIGRILTFEKWNGYANNSLGTPAPTLDKIIFVEFPDSNELLTALENGTIDTSDLDFADGQSHNKKDIFDRLTISSTTKVVTNAVAKWQELGYNMASPIWGINPIEPCEAYKLIEPCNEPPTSASPPDTTTTTTTASITETVTASNFGDIWLILGGVIALVIIKTTISRKRR